jgi:hypothetical protein
MCARWAHSHIDEAETKGWLASVFLDFFFVAAVVFTLAEYCEGVNEKRDKTGQDKMFEGERESTFTVPALIEL